MSEFMGLILGRYEAKVSQQTCMARLLPTPRSCPCGHQMVLLHQGMHRLEKYLNLEGFLEKSLKIKSALKIAGKPPRSLEKSLNSAIFCRTVDIELNQYKIVVPICCTKYRHNNFNIIFQY